MKKFHNLIRNVEIGNEEIKVALRGCVCFVCFYVFFLKITFFSHLNTEVMEHCAVKKLVGVVVFIAW